MWLVLKMDRVYLLIPAQMGMWEGSPESTFATIKIFQVYAIDARGHGKSSWTPGARSWKIIGEDMKNIYTKCNKTKSYP